ncbi:MAG: methionyl-tRNA formyltransferase, partial [Candidatus Methylomirabilales bacterium]
PEFAIPSLRKLVEEHQVLAVVTQPDRPAGRGQKLTPPPVKLLAQDLGLPLLQPLTAKDEAFLAKVRELHPELIVVVAYGQFLPKELLSLPPRGSINLHPSLLPRYRGAAPIHWAIIRGETVTGVTVMLITQEMDAGPILLQREEPISPDDTAGTLQARLASLGALVLREALKLLEQGKLQPIPQDERLASYAPKLKAEDGLIPWGWGARQLYNLIRGLSPEPAAYTFFKGKRLKVLTSAVVAEEGEGDAPGTILKVEKDGLLVQAGRGALRLLTVQPEGKRIMTAPEFARGARLQPGDAFDGSRV